MSNLPSPETQAAQFFVVADRSHLRMYRERRSAEQISSRMELVHAVDLPQARLSYAERNTDAAGRFPRGTGKGGSIDERLPMQQREERRDAEELAHQIDAFVRDAAPGAGWNLAAPKTELPQILPLLSADSRRSLRRVLGQDLVNQPLSELLDHFAKAEEAPPRR